MPCAQRSSLRSKSGRVRSSGASCPSPAQLAPFSPSPKRSEAGLTLLSPCRIDLTAYQPVDRFIPTSWYVNHRSRQKTESKTNLLTPPGKSSGQGYSATRVEGDCGRHVVSHLRLYLELFGQPSKAERELASVSSRADRSCHRRVTTVSIPCNFSNSRSPHRSVTLTGENGQSRR